jgi:hypothetical protein
MNLSFPTGFGYVRLLEEGGEETFNAVEEALVLGLLFWCGRRGLDYWIEVGLAG